MPVPKKTFFLVERASCPFQNFIKRTFARGLFAITISNLKSQISNLKSDDGANQIYSNTVQLVLKKPIVRRLGFVPQPNLFAIIFLY
ncbi:hypothetical protein QUB70_02095 [Microcoleus sp. A003_D6]